MRQGFINKAYENFKDESTLIKNFETIITKEKVID